MLPLLILRPEPGASRTAAAATALGLCPQIVPLFALTPTGWQVPDPGAFDALLLTSANAARLAGPGFAALAQLPCYAVGTATAAAARARGVDPVQVGTAGVQALVDAMVANGARAILWLAAADRSPLTAARARITPIAIYAATAIADPPGWAAAAAQPAVALLHSVRAARRAATLAGQARNHLIALAISDAVAMAAGPGWAGCAVATGPDDSAMLALARQLCQMRAP